MTNIVLFGAHEVGCSVNAICVWVLDALIPRLSMGMRLGAFMSGLYRL